jgi:hypothetical protein
MNCKWNGSLQHLMVRFLEGVPSSEVYRDAIEHKVGRELTSAARECSGQIPQNTQNRPKGIEFITRMAGIAKMKARGNFLNNQIVAK